MPGALICSDPDSRYPRNWYPEHRFATFLALVSNINETIDWSINLVVSGPGSRFRRNVSLEHRFGMFLALFPDIEEVVPRALI